MTDYHSSVDSKGTPFVVKLLKHLDFQGGFYIEAGANDGITQSNTKYFEDALGWTGLLVEPSRAAYDQLVVNRPRNHLRNVCLVSDTYAGTTIRGDFDGSLMSSVAGARLGASATPLTEVPCARLGDLLDELKVDKVDFLSLDTEGYELEVLRGLDMTRHHPRFVLVETYRKHRRQIFKFLRSHGYELVEDMSGFNKKDNPIWDGTHNDYLFRHRPDAPKNWLTRILSR